MKLILYLGLLLAAFSGFAQENDLDDKIERYQKLISQSEAGERLIWMDSLTSLVENNVERNYDSLALETINYALKLDSMHIAADNINDLLYYYANYESDYERCYTLFDSYKDKIPKMLPKDVSRMYLQLGNAYQYDYRNTEALQAFDSAINYAKKANYPRYVSTATDYKGQIYSLQGKYIEAYNAFKSAEVLFYEVQDTSKLVGIKTALGYLFTQQEFYDEAFSMREEAIDLAKRINELGTLSILYNNHGNDFAIQKDFKNSIRYGKLALDTNEKYEFKDFLQVPLLSSLVKNYLLSDSLQQAKSYVEEIKKMGALEAMNGQDRWFAEDALSYYHYETGEYEKALTYALSKTAEMNTQVQAEELIEAEKLLADIYGQLNMANEQNKHLSRHLELNDSINSIKKSNTIAFYQSLFQKEQQESRIANQESEITILAEKDKVKNQWILFGSFGLLTIFGGILLFRSRNNYRRQQQLQEKFSQDLMEAQEEERNRVAKDLHDSVGQQLTLIKRKAQNLNQAELAAMTSNTLDEVRSISRALYPPMLLKLGLSKSIDQTLFELDEETELFISSEIDPEIDKIFSEEETLNFYRFVQEGVNNVIKHANASTLEVNISKEKDKVVALIRDNGIGFDDIQKLTRKSLGLKTMTERIKVLGGRLSIKSQEGQGTWVTAEINM